MKGILYFCKITFPSFFTTLIGNAPWTITVKYPSFMVYRQILSQNLLWSSQLCWMLNAAMYFYFPLIFATTLSVTPPLLCTSLHNTCTVNIWPPLSRCRWRWRGSAPGFPSPRSWRWRTTRTSWWVGHVLLITVLLIIITMLLLITAAGGAARGGPHPPPLPPRLGRGAGALQLWRRPLLPRPRQVSRSQQAENQLGARVI